MAHGSCVLCESASSAWWHTHHCATTHHGGERPCGEELAVHVCWSQKAKIKHEDPSAPEGPLPAKAGHSPEDEGNGKQQKRRVPDRFQSGIQVQMNMSTSRSRNHHFALRKSVDKISKLIQKEHVQTQRKRYTEQMELRRRESMGMSS